MQINIKSYLHIHIVRLHVVVVTFVCLNGILSYNVCNNRNGFGSLDKMLNSPNEATVITTTSAVVATAAATVVVQLLFEYKQNVECEIHDKLFAGIRRSSTQIDVYVFF